MAHSAPGTTTMSSGLTMSQMNRTSPTGSQGCSPVTANCGGAGAVSTAGSGSGSGAPQPTAIIVANPNAASFAALMKASSQVELATGYHRGATIRRRPRAARRDEIIRRCVILRSRDANSCRARPPGLP